jgi:hypothetical protein
MYTLRNVSIATSRKKKHAFEITLLLLSEILINQQQTMSIVPDGVSVNSSSNPMTQESDDPPRKDIEDPSPQAGSDNHIDDGNAGTSPCKTTGDSAGLEPCQGCNGLMSRDYLCSLCDKAIHWWCAKNGEEGMGHGKHYLCPKCGEEETVSQNENESTLEVTGKKGDEGRAGASIAENEEENTGAINRDVGNNADEPEKKRKKGRKKKAIDGTSVSQDGTKVAASISEATKTGSRIRKQPDVYSPGNDPKRQKKNQINNSRETPAIDSVSTGLIESNDQLAVSSAEESSGEHEDEEKDEEEDEEEDEDETSDSTEIGRAPWFVAKKDNEASFAPETFTFSSSQVIDDEVIDVDEEDIAVPFDADEFSTKNNIEQQMVITSSTCLFNIHFLTLSLLVHSTEQYLVCKSNIHHLE